LGFSLVVVVVKNCLGGWVSVVVGEYRPGFLRSAEVDSDETELARGLHDDLRGFESLALKEHELKSTCADMPKLK
jgi:hypothetical protein